MGCEFHITCRALYLSYSESRDLGRITTSEQTASTGKMIPDKTGGAWSNADASIAAAQRMAFPIKYLLFIDDCGFLLADI